MPTHERITRLRVAARKSGGNASLGRRLGYKDGAYIGQMLRGERPITEHVMMKISSLHDLADVFADQGEFASDTPESEGVAHEQSLTPFSVAPLKTAGEIMKGISEEEFRYSLVDDAVSPDFERGVHIIFSRTRPARPGRLILIQSGEAELHVRVYAQGQTSSAWKAAPHPSKDRVYRTFDSETDAVRIVGVYRGVYEPFDD